MADSNTTTYSFTLPEVGASADSWGTKLNANWDKVDDLLDGSIAVNGITVTGGSIDGTPVGATTPSTGAFTTVTTTGNVDVTGTVTADGLTVDGSGAIELKGGGIGQDIEWGSSSQDYAAIRVTSPSAADIDLDIHTSTAAGTDGTPLRAKFSHNGDVSFYEDTGTTAKMVWDASAESLGIGGTPSTILDVIGEAPTLTLRDSRAGGTWSAGTALGKLDFYTSDGTGIGAHSIASIGVVAGGANTASPDGELVFSTGPYNVASVERMRIDSSGNVGIANSSPVTRLDIDGFITLRNSAYPSPATGVFKDGFIGSNDGTLTYAVNGASNGAYGSHKFQVRKGDSSDAIDAMTIDSSGNVGIGNASPSRPLDVHGGTIGVTSSTAFSGLQITSANNSFAYVNFGDSDDANIGQIRYDHLSNAMVVTTNNSERARIDSSGKFMLGTTSGAGRFNIAQSGNVWAQTINHSNATQFFIDFQQNGSQVGSITGNGTNASYNTTSDERLKENIKDTTHVVNIDDIRVREYDWKVDGSHQRFGFIAQELEAVYPEAVTSPEDENEMKSVDYSKLVPLLVKEIQTLKARIETLENN